MACNENVIKNMANEVTRNCQVHNINVEPEFVVYLIELLLLNPKYGKLFTKTLNRNCLAYFVEECGSMITRGGTPLNTLKMQFIMRCNYDKLQNLVDKHLDSVDTCLAPLLNEILEAEPESDDLQVQEAWLKKIYRKISIYTILYSGLGNPALIMTLKEGMAALESVFSLKELGDLLLFPKHDRHERLEELLALSCGVRLFNRDCQTGGEMLPDLPFDLVDAGNACLASLSNSLMSVMQRVNMLTTAVEDRMIIDDETGKVLVDVPFNMGLTLDDYEQIFGLLIFNRQYEIYIRRLLNDARTMVETSKTLVDRNKKVLDELHSAVKYKTAVPCDTVFPLFIKLWQVWRSMQNTMFLVSTVNRLMAILNGIQEHNKIPMTIIERMLMGKTVVTDEERMKSVLNTDVESSLQILQSSAKLSLDQQQPTQQDLAKQDLELSTVKHVAFLGFCAMSLNVGALVPSNIKIGFIRHKKNRYGFSSLKMAAKFVKDPDRYINEALQYARNHPQIINLLDMEEDVRSVRDIEPLVSQYVPTRKLNNKDCQTEVHPIEEYIEHNYNWDLWEWKRRACQWANIVKCQTHSTQTNYSHMRSEIHCQTVEPRDKCLQTMKEAGINTNTCNFFFWGLRGQIGAGQHLMDMVPKHRPEKALPKQVYRCTWPCDKSVSHISTGSSSSEYSEYDSLDLDDNMTVYNPNV